MTKIQKRYWFKAKQYGWGWTPSTWEGWAVTGVYLTIIFIITGVADKHATFEQTVYTFILPLTISIIVLTGICYYTGEKPEWRWGGTIIRKK